MSMQTNKKDKIAVIGAGIMGLTAAYELAKQGCSVTVFEKDDRTGGMSASFDFDGLTIEKYYHFFCKPDKPVIDLLEELGISQYLHWKETKMGFFYNGKLYKWGNPIALFLFPRLGLIAKLRFGLQVFLSIKRKRWDRLDRLTAMRWLKGFLGEKAYDVLWDSLLRLKFHEYREPLSAAWVWRRLKRVGLSRKNMLTEELAYLEGGVQRILSALETNIKKMNGNIILNAAVTAVEKNKDGFRLQAASWEWAFDRVISTIPIPYIPRIIRGLPQDALGRYEQAINIAVVCVILKLKRPLTPNFWLNISDPGISLPGMIEFSNINPLAETIVYFPYYLPRTHGSYRKSDQDFLVETTGYCKRINKDFEESWVLAGKVHRYEYAQPVCPPRHLKMLPPLETALPGLYIVDTSYYYPEDRSISESIEMGKRIARLVPAGDP